MWSNALLSLQLTSQAEALGKKEKKTKEEEKRTEQTMMEERKVADEANQKNGFAYIPTSTAAQMQASINQYRNQVIRMIKDSNRQHRGRLIDEMRATRAETAESSLLLCIPPRSASEVTATMSWYQTIMDSKYGIKECACITNTDNSPMTISSADLKETRILNSYSGIGPNMTPKRIEYVSVEFKDYAPQVFSKIRTYFGISLINYIDELCSSDDITRVMVNKKLNSNPKFADRFYWYSSTGEYIIKGVKEDQFKYYLSFLGDYFTYITDNNVDSFLPKIFGMHRVRNSQRHDPIFLIVMKNIFYGPFPPHTRFEIKGSTLGREASPEEANGTVKLLKDNDFKETDIVYLRSEQKEMFMNQFKKDVQFLTKIKAMDYTFNIAIAKKDQQVNNNPPVLPTGVLSLAAYQKHNKSNKNKEKPRECRTLIDTYGQRQRELEIEAYNEEESTMTDDMKEIYYRLKDNEMKRPLVGLPYTTEISETAKLSNWTIEYGGVLSAIWDKMRKTYRSGDEIVYFGITGIFQQYSFNKKFEAWWKRGEQGRSCLPPDEYGERLVKKLDNMISYESQKVQRVRPKDANATTETNAPARTQSLLDEVEDA